jgi:hypothetical protein
MQKSSARLVVGLATQSILSIGDVGSSGVTVVGPLVGDMTISHSYSRFLGERMKLEFRLPLSSRELFEAASSMGEFCTVSIAVGSSRCYRFCKVRFGKVRVGKSTFSVVGQVMPTVLFLQ